MSNFQFLKKHKITHLQLDSQRYYWNLVLESPQIRFVVDLFLIYKVYVPVLAHEPMLARLNEFLGKIRKIVNVYGKKNLNQFCME